MRYLRIGIQIFFILVTITAVFIIGGNAERWCPMGGVEAMYTYLYEGNMPCSLGISNFYILIAILVLTIVLRRVFCGYICPIGAISEFVRKAGQMCGIPKRNVPANVDYILSLGKYFFLAIILWWTYTLGELWFRGIDPCYAIISRHGEDITIWAYIALGSIVAASIFWSVPFCRWLCPFAAVLNPFSKLGLFRIKRNPTTCIECHKCDKNCPMAIKVSQVQEVKDARCIACHECAHACPVPDTLSYEPSLWWQKLLGKRTYGQLIIPALLMIVISIAVLAYELKPLASFVKSRGEISQQTSMVICTVENLTCRGRANLFFYFLTRDDDYELSGYLKVEVWPDPTLGRCRITYDPEQTNVDAIILAIEQPYFDSDANIWRSSPFQARIRSTQN